MDFSLYIYCKQHEIVYIHNLIDMADINLGVPSGMVDKAMGPFTGIDPRPDAHEVDSTLPSPLKRNKKKELHAARVGESVYILVKRNRNLI